MKFLLTITLFCLWAMPCQSQDKLPLPSLFFNLEDKPAERPAKAAATKSVPKLATPPTAQDKHNDYLDKLTAAPTATAKITSAVGDDSSDALRAELVEIRNALNYLYLTRPDETRVRAIVVEELAKVNIRYADNQGHVRSTSMSIGSNYSGQVQLKPGEKLLSYSDPITGRIIRVSDLPVESVSLASQPQPVAMYSTPTAAVYVTQGSASRPVRAAIKIPEGSFRTLLRGRAASRQALSTQNFYSGSGGQAVCVNGKCN